MYPPDFYLASSDSYDMEQPRGCWKIHRMSTESRDDLLLIKIDPPITGQKYGLGAKNIDLVLIATRHEGKSLFPITEWPVFVHVARFLIDDPQDYEKINKDQFQSIAWAELYKTEKDAQRKLM